MKFSELVALDSSLELQLNTSCEIELESISHSDAPRENTFCFVKNQNFLTSVGRRSTRSQFKKSGIVLEEAFFANLGEDIQNEVAAKFNFVATIKDVALAMCTLSKPFYELKFSNLNLQVDGRKMGNTLINPTSRISEGVFIGEFVKIGANVTIMPGCTILPHSEIGDNSILFPNVTLYSHVTIGEACRIHSGTVIGGDGFGYHFSGGAHQKIWHLCGVEIGNDVEIGVNSMIDCGAFIPTSIGDGSKLDNCVQISHNAVVGKHNIFCGGSGVSGSTEVGDYNVFAAGAGCAQNVKLGSGIQLAAKAIVSENSVINEKVVLAGHPARPLKEWLRGQATLRKLSKR